MNKYEAFGLEPLIRHIQEDEIRMKDPKYKKTLSTVTVSRRSIELREMKMSAMERLRKLDRRKPSYFPIGTIVLYKHPDSFKEAVNAIVHGHRGNYVIIKQEGEIGLVEVEPIYLKIKFLRIIY